MTAATWPAAFVKRDGSFLPCLSKWGPETRCELVKIFSLLPPSKDPIRICNLCLSQLRGSLD